MFCDKLRDDLDNLLGQALDNFEDSQTPDQKLDKDSPAWRAARSGDVAELKAHIREGVDVNEADDYGSTMLHAAAEQGHTEVVRLLLSKGADVRPNERGSTPLDRAASGGHADIVRLFFKQGVLDESENKQPKIQSLLIKAASSGSCELVELLLDMGADAADEDPDRRTTPLYEAVHGGSPEVVRLLLDNGAHVNPGQAERGVDTPLHFAARDGTPDLVAILVGHGADIHARNEDGVTPLHKAAGSNTGAVQVLLDAGADPTCTDNVGVTPLHHAASKSRETVELLVQEGADVNRTDQDGEMSLHYAAAGGMASVAEFLIGAGADVNCIGRFREFTPLHTAADRGNPEVAKVLLESGSDPTRTDGAGRTPLEIAGGKDSMWGDHDGVVEVITSFTV